MFKFFKTNHHPDYIFTLCVIILTVFGLIMLSSASSDLGKMDFNDPYHYLKHQIFYGLSFGIIGYLLTSYFNYKKLKKLAVPFLIISVIFLILVFTPLGFSNKGATRWLNLGFFSFQPAELLKISFIVYLAAWLSNRKINRQSSFYRGFLPFSIIAGIIAFLILKQPATTTLIIIMAAALIIYFFSGAKIRYILGIILGSLMILALIIYFTPYRYERIVSFLKFKEGSGEIQQTSGYQLDKSLVAIGSGGLFGIGFGKSTTKYKYLPEPIGDSIFAVIAEELGFVGSFFLISIFINLLIRGFLIAIRADDQFAKLIAMGLISVIGIQTFIHIAAVSGLIPLTGVSLPFISYGGTSLAVFLTMAGIIGNISKNT